MRPPSGEPGWRAEAWRERDLHDGAQQRLVIAALWLERAGEHARGTAAEPLVSEASRQLREGLVELRNLAHGLHPAVLSERGLAAALEGLVARSPVPVDLQVPSRRAAPAAEAAVYFTVASGSGLRGLADRMDALGGTLTVESPAHGGTLVRAVVPALG
jgi:signal transduction histidine kinase